MRSLEPRRVMGAVIRWMQRHGMDTALVYHLHRSLEHDRRTLRFYAVESLPAAEAVYDDGQVRIVESQVDEDGIPRDEVIPKLLHELTHAYVDVSDAFSRFRVDDGDPTGLVHANREMLDRLPGPIYDRSILADEAVGWYVENVANILAQVARAPSESVAQRLWDRARTDFVRRQADGRGGTIRIRLRSARHVDLDQYGGPTDVVIPTHLAREIRRRCFGLPDDVRRWPDARKTWPHEIDARHAERRLAAYLDHLRRYEPYFQRVRFEFGAGRSVTGPHIRVPAIHRRRLFRSREEFDEALDEVLEGLVSEWFERFTRR